MQAQTCFGREPLLAREGVVVIDHRERFQEVAARLGETIGHVDELPPGVGQAVRQDRPERAREVARQGIAHLDRWRAFRGAVFEHPGQVLTRVATAAEEQGHAVTVAQRDHA
jgi:hypothetical protein